MYPDSGNDGRPARDAFFQSMKSLGTLLSMPGKSVDHAGIIAHLAEEGRLCARYAMLTALSCAIAVLGLLLSSPAVIIGAMLISPLMGPIILFGFSLALLDQRLAFRSFVAVASERCLPLACRRSLSGCRRFSR